jgi:hypothetical protein
MCVSVCVILGVAGEEKYRLLVNSPVGSYYFFVVAVVAVLGFELWAYTLIHSTSPFFFFLWCVFFEIGCHKLFA